MTSVSPTICPMSLMRVASGVVKSWLMMIGGQVSPRDRIINRVCVPLPEPGAPPSKISSFGKRRFWWPTSSSSDSQTVSKMTWASLISSSKVLGGLEFSAD